MTPGSLTTGQVLWLLSCAVYERRVLRVGHQLLLPGFLSLDILQNDLTDVTLLPPAYLLLLSVEEVMDDDTPLALGKPHFFFFLKPHFLSPPTLPGISMGQRLWMSVSALQTQAFLQWGVPRLRLVKHWGKKWRSKSFQLTI